MADENQQEQEAAPRSSGGLMGKLIMTGFMGAVILTECLIAYFWIPSADDIAALAHKKMTDSMYKLKIEKDESGLIDQKKFAEFDLGDFSITSHQAATNSAFRVDFKLFGTVDLENEEELETQFKQIEQRFREQVIFEIRNSDATDLDDPGLGLIKRRILERVNRLFGETLIETLGVSNYSWVEQ